MLLDATTMSSAYWDRKDAVSAECLAFDTDNADKLGEYPKYTIWFTLGLSVLLDILCWRWKKVAYALFYLECA